MTESVSAAVIRKVQAVVPAAMVALIAVIRVLFSVPPATETMMSVAWTVSSALTEEGIVLNATFINLG